MGSGGEPEKYGEAPGDRDEAPEGRDDFGDRDEAPESLPPCRKSINNDRASTRGGVKPSTMASSAGESMSPLRLR